MNKINSIPAPYLTAIEASIMAGEKIMEIYSKGNFEITSKSDDSPLTRADTEANKIINKYLIETGIPIISEENRQDDFSVRKTWKKCWIVDPLDGTKEFIKKSGEFTVNIALIEDNKAIFGVIYLPVKRMLYYGNTSEKKSFKIELKDPLNFQNEIQKATELNPGKMQAKIRIAGSRSHMNKKTVAYIAGLSEKYNKETEIITKGSSLKFCLVAEGKADVYPRLAPTMEWDSAAGQAICNAVGVRVVDVGTSEEMLYNREKLLNNSFVVSNLE